MIPWNIRGSLHLSLTVSLTLRSTSGKSRLASLSEDESVWTWAFWRPQVYPPPPPWYKLFRSDAEGTAERPLPPEPPALPTQEFQMFGRMESVSLPCMSAKMLLCIMSQTEYNKPGPSSLLDGDYKKTWFQVLCTINKIIQCYQHNNRFKYSWSRSNFWQST